MINEKARYVCWGGGDEGMGEGKEGGGVMEGDIRFWIESDFRIKLKEGLKMGGWSQDGAVKKKKKMKRLH